MPSIRCHGQTITGRQCRKRTCMEGKCWIHGLKEDGLRVKNSQIPNAGKGLFAMKEFKKGDLVCTYEGKVISADRAERNTDKQNEYVIKTTRNSYIDASKPTSCWGRFINSKYNTGRQANVRYCQVRSANSNSLSIRAIKKIRPDTELLVNYGGRGGYYNE